MTEQSKQEQRRRRLEALVRLSREALAGPLGYLERQRCQESLSAYLAELEQLREGELA